MVCSLEGVNLIESLIFGIPETVHCIGFYIRHLGLMVWSDYFWYYYNIINSPQIMAAANKIPPSENRRKRHALGPKMPQEQVIFSFMQAAVGGQI